MTDPSGTSARLGSAVLEQLARSAAARRRGSRACAPAGRRCRPRRAAPRAPRRSRRAPTRRCGSARATPAAHGGAELGVFEHQEVRLDHAGCPPWRARAARPRRVRGRRRTAPARPRPGRQRSAYRGIASLSSRNRNTRPSAMPGEALMPANSNMRGAVYAAFNGRVKPTDDRNGHEEKETGCLPARSDACSGPRSLVVVGGGRARGTRTRAAQRPRACSAASSKERSRDADSPAAARHPRRRRRQHRRPRPRRHAVRTGHGRRRAGRLAMPPAAAPIPAPPAAVARRRRPTPRPVAHEDGAAVVREGRRRGRDRARAGERGRSPRGIPPSATTSPPSSPARPRPRAGAGVVSLIPAGTAVRSVTVKGDTADDRLQRAVPVQRTAASRGCAPSCARWSGPPPSSPR